MHAHDPSAYRGLDAPTRPRAGIVVALVIAFLVSTAAAYLGSAKVFEGQAASVAQSQHALYLRSLNEAIEQHQHLPFVLSRNPEIAQRLAEGDARRLNPMLEAFAEASGLEAIYVMDLDGYALAASNFATPASFLGQNYGFRPYFKGAAQGTRSDYFAIGATTGRPGYFVAEPLRAKDGVLIGVIAIKVDISELQHSWEERGEHVLATNADGIVVLSSNPAWLYRSIAALDPTHRAEIRQSRQFGSEPLQPLGWTDRAEGRVDLDGQGYRVTSGKTDLLRWSVHYLTPEDVFLRQTLLATGALSALIAVVIGFAAFLRSRRIVAALALSQEHRRELVAANAELIRARDELAQSSKLAALGQLAASVTHELGQPISALKNHLLAAEIGNEITSKDTLGSLRRLADRMEGITKQLKFFARPSREEKKETDLATVIDEALALVAHDLLACGVTVRSPAIDAPLTVMGNQLQLEQAMVNLLRNALEAAKDRDGREITIDCVPDGDDLRLRIADPGPGLEGRSLEMLKEPFFSTRSSGDGMGLGLAITAEIVRAHGGVMSAWDAEGGGAVFEISLPQAGRGRK